MKANLSHFPTLIIEGEKENTQFEFNWKRKRGNKIIATITLQEIFPDFNNTNDGKTIDEWSGQAVCKDSDEFCAIFGMRQAVTNLFKKVDFDRKDRTEFYEMFDNLYGRGLCVEKY